MEKILIQKSRERTLLFDGAMGTMLMAHGLGRTEVPEVWTQKHPGRVKGIHERYYAAGADVVHTNTFGGNALKLAARDLSERMVELNREAVRIAREACPPGKFVAGDVGPTGKLLQPLGDLSPEAAEEVFSRQVEVLVEAGVDLISIETMFHLEEALAALRGAKRAAGDIPVSACVTFTRTKRGFFTVMGDGVEQCARALEDTGADIVGSNCTLDSTDMIELTRHLRATTGKPVLIQPNAGKPVTRKGVTHYDQRPEDFARDCKGIQQAGADMIGGCCGTDDAYIKALAGVLAEPAPV